MATLEFIVTTLAHEGVPIAAIARSTKRSSTEITDILKRAVEYGRLVALPKHDWSAGSTAPPAVPPVLSPSRCILAISSKYKMTVLQAAIFNALIRRAQLSRQDLHNVIESQRPDNENPTCIKMVDVLICHVRRKLRIAGFQKDTVRTLWGVGYTVAPDMRKQIMKALYEHANDLESESGSGSGSASESEQRVASRHCEASQL